MTASQPPEDQLTDFDGDAETYEAEDNRPAKTAGEEPHEDPWKYADQSAQHSPPENPA